MKWKIKKQVMTLAGLILLGAGVKTYRDIQPIEQLYWSVMHDAQNLRITDRHGQPLLIDYHHRWNHHDQQPLHHFPVFLVDMLILSEDQHFFQHHGIDWYAKMSAAWQNIKARRVVRGASTITEQVVHLLTNRPRTLWAKWLELIEAHLLERKISKNHILEFYINQVPFASNRHGMTQAARYYFDRDLSTLTSKEILALVILIKAPSSYDLKKSVLQVTQKIEPLIKRLHAAGVLTSAQVSELAKQTLVLSPSKSLVNAHHFVRFLQKYHQPDLHLQRTRLIRTTLDITLQNYVQRVLDQRLRFLKNRQVHNGAVVVMDHTTGEILAWVVGGATLKKGETPSSMIDAVMALRQPGSLLKPFVYAMALTKEWTSTTIIDDAPLTGPVGTGMHKFKNYSNVHYGSVTLREALANSLNVPAVKTIQYVGTAAFLKTLKQLGFQKLQHDGADIYEEGLALGNGEVTLLELVQAYGTLANKGNIQEPKFFMQYGKKSPLMRVFPSTITSIISDILSDPWARRLEFGTASVMNLPVQTAIKTGTSSDYRDASIVGYNHKYVVGIWMGNLDNTPMDGVTGAIGPALSLRSIFSFLNQYEESNDLYKSPELVQRDICVKRDFSTPCIWHTELALPTTEKESIEVIRYSQQVKLLKPTQGLQMAIDPRIPLANQKFEFKLSSLGAGNRVEWFVNDTLMASTTRPVYAWPLSKGKKYVKALIYNGKNVVSEIPEIKFLVK